MRICVPLGTGQLKTNNNRVVLSAQRSTRNSWNACPGHLPIEMSQFYCHAIAKKTFMLVRLTTFPVIFGKYIHRVETILLKNLNENLIGYGDRLPWNYQCQQVGLILVSISQKRRWTPYEVYTM